MEVTFTKLDGGDHEILVTGRTRGPDVRHGRAETSSPMPHDLAHLAAEQALGITDGFWGAIDAGATFGGFEPVDRSARHRTGGAKVLRRKGEAVMRAELVVSFSYRVWSGRDVRPDAIGTPPIEGEPLQRALRALDEAGAAWSALDVGRSLTRTW